MLKFRIKSVLRLDFARHEDGSVAIETVILLPMLFWAFLSMFSIFDAFRQYSINQKAAFTIGDMVSRETAAIDNDYLDGAQELFDYMTRSSDEISLRISSLRYNETLDKFQVDWSQTRGTAEKLEDDDVREWNDRLPVLPNDEHIMVVETWMNYDPPFSTGFEDRVIRNFVFTRPRYAPKVSFNNFSIGSDG